jgi:hypothetical protein
VEAQTAVAVQQAVQVEPDHADNFRNHTRRQI